MSKRAARTLLIVLCGLALAVATALASGATSDDPLPPIPIELDEGKDGFLVSRQMLGDPITTAGLQAAAAQARNVSLQPASPTAQWDFVGPTNIGGRLTDIALDPTQANTLFIATATGGVWKSTNAGATLSAAWNSALPQATGAVAVAPNGTVYVGTGEVNPGGGSLAYGGDGLYRSTDGGATWTPIGLLGSGAIGAIRIDPTDPNRIFVAAAGSLFTPGGTRGVYRSVDGGTTWQLVLSGPNGFTGASELAMDPTNPDRIYAVLWDHHREWDRRVYAGVGSGLYRTIDGGDTWTRLENITTLTTGDTIGLTSNPAQGRIGVAIAPSNPSRIYVVTGGPTAFRGYYRSDDGGDSFTTMTAANPGSPIWWFAKLWVDPANADRLFVAGVSLVTSSNAGSSWSSVSGLHADHHAMVWDPAVPNRAYEGNDGGLYRSTSNGASGSWVKATSEPYTQFYSVDVSEQDPTRIVGGTQDNGCIRSWDTTGAVTGAWTSYGLCGDGLYTIIDYTDQTRVYACSQFGSCSVSFTSGDASVPLATATSDRDNWQAPLVLDPTTPSTVYYGGNRLNLSPDFGLTFAPISPDLTGGPGQDPNYPFGTITTVAPAKTAPNTIYVGTDDARLWKTIDLGSNWTQLTDPDLPQRWVTRVAVDPTNANIVYATYSGFRNGDNTAHILRSTDGGTNWNDISGNLPGAPTQDVVIHPTGSPIIVASDVGVFVANAGSALWSQLGSGLPLAPVNDIRYHAPSNTVYAATYGRGIWKTILHGPTAARLQSMSAVRAPRGAVIRWRTASELQLLGFNLYREHNGSRVKLARSLIQSVGKGTRGHAYSWRDRSLPTGRRVVYRLQAVSLSGERTWIGRSVLDR